MAITVAVGAVEDEVVKSALTLLTTFINKSTPFVAFQYVDVTFSASANADTDIKHTLAVKDPTAIDYHVVRVDRAAKIYHDNSATKKTWTSGLIYLRSDTASAVATILLTVRPT